MRIEKLLKQLKREFIKVNVLQALLDGLLFFLIANMVLFVLKIQIVSGSRATTVSLFNFAQISLQMALLFGISIVISAIDLYYRSKQYRLEIFEEENPELREILRTARDNLDNQNIVSQALFEETLEKARKVTSESIIPAKEIIYKTLAVGFLSFLTVMSGLADFQVGGEGTDILNNPQDQIDDLIDNERDNETDIKNATDISGNADEIDTSNLDIEFSVEGEGEADPGEFDPTQGPPEEDLVLDASSDTNTEDLEIAKQYSLAIRELG